MVQWCGGCGLTLGESPSFPLQRLTKSLPGEQRDTAAAAYVHHDLLGFTDTGNYQVGGVSALLDSGECGWVHS